jgi:hemerythrin-like domain-containing protein
MDPLVEQLRGEHTVFADHLAALRSAAATVVTDDADPRALVDEILDFLVYNVRPHSAAEDETFYPIVERAFGSTGAAALLLADHRTVDRLTEELHELARQLPDHTIDRVVRVELSGLLFGIDTSLRQHLSKEEAIVFPTLDRIMTADGRRDVLARQANFTAMHRAAASVADDPEPTED